MSNKPQKAIALTKKHIDALSPVAIATDPAVRQQFVNKFVQMYQVPEQEAIRFYEREKDNFSKLVSQSDALRQCTPMSLYFAFMKVGALKLSFDNGRKPLVYLIPGRRNIGTPENKKYINEVTASPSPEGEKEVRINNGILKKVGQPHIVHEGDKFVVKLNKDTDEVEVMEYEELNKTNKIIASFIRLVEPDGIIVWKVFRPNHWARWMAASTKKNYGRTNPLYTSGPGEQIDEGFLKGKTILHSFHGYKQVDFLYQQPQGFEPDKKAAAQLNENFMDDLTVDTDYVEKTPEQPADDFTQAVQEDDPEKESVKPSLNDDDDMFN